MGTKLMLLGILLCLCGIALKLNAAFALVGLIPAIIGLIKEG